MADSLRYETAVKVLLQYVPEFRRVSNFENDESEPTYVFGVFGLFLRDTIMQGSTPVETIETSFNLLNEMASSDDDEIVNLIEVTVFEILTDSPKTIGVARQRLFGKALSRFEQVVQTWKG